MVRKIMLLAVLVIALPLALESAAAKPCKKWNAASANQHHRVGNNLDIVGGHGYGSGRHQAQYRSPPQRMGAYGDPQRRAAQGGYIQFVGGQTIIHVNLFGPLDETDTTHLYDTSFGACVSQGNTKVDTQQRCLATSRFRPPAGAWTPCGGY
jgi:hypothetical protein